MKSITEYLFIIRRKAIITDLKIIGWKIYTISLVFFVFALILENIFYLSVETRVITLGVFCTIGLTLLIWLFVILFKTYNNSFKKYNLSNLAKKVGSIAFSKKDTLINAFQLERSKTHTYSRALREQFISRTINELNKTSFENYFPIEIIDKWRKITFISLLFLGVIILSSWSHSTAAMYRWTHASTEFIPPKPFNIDSKTGHLNVLGGEDVYVSFETNGSGIPDSLFIEFTPLIFDTKTDSTIIKSALVVDNQFSITLNDVFQNYQYRSFYKSAGFWQAWDEISSKKYSISVTDRPSMTDFTLKIISPSYTKLPTKTQKANQAEIQAVLGSKIEVNLKSNQILAKADILLDQTKEKMNTNGKDADYSFSVVNDQEFSIHLIDERGITNRNPIPFRIKMVNDILPEISIIKPPPIIEIGGDQSIPITMIINDDFGFSNLQLAYEIQRPSYINVEPFISMFNIPINDPHESQQELKTIWDLKPLGLMPEDEIHFHFELYDNDVISGPKKTISSTFIARLPSLKDLFHTFNKKENDIEDLVEIKLSDIQKLQRQLNKAKLDLLKTDKPEWKDQKHINETIKTLENQLNDFQSLKEQINQLNNSGEKHQLFSDDLMKKFKDLQKLIEEIFTPEMLKNMDWLNEALSKLDTKEILSALDELAKNLGEVENELDRFLDIFKRVKAEQQIDELRKRMKSIINNQDNIDRQIRTTSTQSDPSKFKRLAQEERMIDKELNDIRSTLNIAAKNVKDYSRKTAQNLENLSDSDIAESTDDLISQTIEDLDDNNPYDAMENSYAGLMSMESLGTNLDNILSDFQKETTQDMSQKFRTILRDIISLSKAQESLKDDTEETPRNSPRLANLANNQQIIQNQLKQTMKNTISLSKETFLVSPTMGRKLGKANAQMEASKGKLAERNGNGSLGNQGEAMLALNEGAQTIIQTIKQMQDSGSASGYNEFLKQMEQMANQQGDLNQQGSQLALGQLAASMQQSLIEQMLFKQQGIRNSLKQMMEKMAEEGNQGLGDLSGISNEMDQVINDLKRKKFDRETSNRQQRILSRMLDSQKSLTQRGFEDERKSQTAEQIILGGPMGLPENLGQRQSLIMEAMDIALKSGYNNDYQKMIRRYFNALSELETIIKPSMNRSEEVENK